MAYRRIIPCILAASLFCTGLKAGAGSGLGADPASPQQSDEAARLQQIFGSAPTEELFTAEFLNAVPLSRLRTIISQVSSQTGEFLRVTGEASPYTLVMSEGTVSVAVSLNADGLVQGLRIMAINPVSGSLEETLQSLDQLPGAVSYLITRNGEPLAARNPDTPLAVGSAYKLALLRALRDKIEAGQLTWNQVVKLKEEWRSLPTGILQDWPAGSAVTIETLATLMISQSDNTAADALLDIIGRQTAETYAPDSRPLLSTREAFLLKKPENAELREHYLAASVEERRRLLSELGGELPSPELFTGSPAAPEIEWFFTVRQLSRLIEELHTLPLTAINPGVAQKKNWKRVAYKGGSEPGVLNMTYFLKTPEGTAYTVSVTQNRDNAALDESRLVTLVQGLLGNLRNDGASSPNSGG